MIVDIAFYFTSDCGQQCSFLAERPATLTNDMSPESDIIVTAEA